MIKREVLQPGIRNNRSSGEKVPPFITTRSRKGLPAIVVGEDSPHPGGREEGVIDFSRGGERIFSAGGRGGGVD
jgi:hypothetical protein